MADVPLPPAIAPAYETQLGRDPRWALSEGSRHFEEKSAVFQALHRVAKRLKDLGIPYAVVGGMALFQHGLRRFTEDVDILVTKEDLRRIHDNLAGLGYLPPHSRSKHLRDTELGVRIEFLTTGEYPGDGKPKPVAFPEPGPVSFEADGVRYIKLPNLIELKLASGMTNPGRLKDLADVLELIKVLGLPEDFALQLNPFVREKFGDLWKAAEEGDRSDGAEPSTEEGTVRDRADEGPPVPTPDWPFPDAQDFEVIVLDRILRGVSALTLVTHDEDDGAWQFLDGAHVLEDDGVTVLLGEMAQFDPSVLALADLPPGWYARRDGPGGAWERAQGEPPVEP